MWSNHTLKIPKFLELDDQADDDCHSEPDVGKCHSKIKRYYFDKEDKTCKRFTYSGCRGNKNNYHSKSECLDKCKPKGKLKFDELFLQYFSKYVYTYVTFILFYLKMRSIVLVKEKLDAAGQDLLVFILTKMLKNVKHLSLEDAL